MNKHLPQSEITVHNNLSNFYIKTVLNESKEVVIDLPVSQKQFNTFKIGHKVLYFSSEKVQIAYGILRSLSQASMRGLGSVSFLDTNLNYEDISYCRIEPWWFLSIQKPIVTSLACFEYSEGEISTLKASANLSSKHTKGFINWSLSYKSSSDLKTEVAKGNDFYSEGLCKLEREDSLWKPGIYELTAKRISSPTKTLLKQDSCKWSLNIPSNKLLCGGYSDNLPPLYL